MKIRLVRYSLIDNTVIVITDIAPTNITVMDLSGNTFYIRNKTTTTTNLGIVTQFATTSSNIYSLDGSMKIDLSGVCIINATLSEGTINNTARAAMYDEIMFSSTKIDLMTAIMENKGIDKFYKYLVKFLFLESAMNDIAKHSGPIDDVVSFYKELIKIKNSFKTNYHYNDRL